MIQPSPRLYTRLKWLQSLALVLMPLAYLSAQDLVTQPFDLNDHETLLITFFDSDSINEAGEVLWTPMTFSDMVGSNVSDDGMVHTMLDTILYFSAFATQKALVLFETIHYEHGAISDCQACGAQLSAAVFDDIGDGKWQIVRFAKHFTTQGTYGLNGESGLTQMGDNQWCLRLQMSWTGQGIYGEYATFYGVENFEKVFNFTLHEDNMGAFEEGSERAYAFDKAIHFLPNVETESGWWDFDIVMQGTQKLDDVDRAVPANEVIRYQFDWETGTYIKACH